MAGAGIKGLSGTQLEVNASNQAKVVPETNYFTNPGNVGCIRIMSENDSGSFQATPQLMPPETDLDYRLRVAQDSFFDQEVFNYTAQNTGKHLSVATTQTLVFGTNGLTFNGSGITTTNTATFFQSRGTFPIIGTATLSLDFTKSFSNTPVTNVIIDSGFFFAAITAPHAPTDGVYIRQNSAGFSGVVNFNGVETTTSIFTFTPVANKNYQFIIYIHPRFTEFWINDGVSTDMYGKIATPDGQGMPCMSAALPFSMRHSIGGTAGGVLSSTLRSYNVRLGGVNHPRSVGEYGNACYGSYQGLSGGAMGSLANYVNNTNPTAAVPTNTTAALGTGLGGQFWETDTLAVNTDGILSSFQVPVAAVSVPGRRLKLVGIRVESFVQTALTGGGYVAQYCLAFGHTTVSLATAEGANSKAPRRIGLGLQAVSSGALAGVVLAPIDIDLKEGSIYVNPGEFVAVVKKKIGVAPTVGVIGHLITPRYEWE